MIKLILDNIIFSIQSAGGISVYWYELLNRIIKDVELNPSFIDGIHQNIFRDNLLIPNSMLLNNQKFKYNLPIQRYINPKLHQSKGIFHSSYYRVTNNPNIVNITTVHDFTYEYFNKGFPKLIHQHQKKIAIKNSQCIICVSENTKKDLLKFYPEILDSKIKVIYNGVSDDYKVLNKKEPSSLSHLNPFNSRDFNLYVGDRKSDYKNFKIAVEACHSVNMPLLIVGGGILSHFENSYLETKLGKGNFHSLIGLSNEMLNTLYNKAFCLIYPSFYEGFGIPVIEAQKAGCPVICSTYSSIPEVAGNGAILLDNINSKNIAESIDFLSSNPVHKDKIILNGTINANRFSWEKCYQQTKELYTEVYSEYFLK